MFAWSKTLRRTLLTVLLVGLITLVGLPAVPAGAVPPPQRGEDLVNPAAKDTYRQLYEAQEDGVREPINKVDIPEAIEETLEGARRGAENVGDRVKSSLGQNRQDERQDLRPAPRSQTR